MEPMLDPSILALTAQTGLTLANFLPQEDDDDYEDTGIPEIQVILICYYNFLVFSASYKED